MKTRLRWQTALNVSSENKTFRNCRYPKGKHPSSLTTRKASTIMLRYDEYGSRDNPTILMLHGAGTLDTFCQQYSFSEKYHLVVPHLPGAGKAAGEVYEPEKTAQELYDLITDLHKDKIGVIGHSLGGTDRSQTRKRATGTVQLRCLPKRVGEPAP